MSGWPSPITRCDSRRLLAALALVSILWIREMCFGVESLFYIFSNVHFLGLRRVTKYLGMVG